MLSGIIEILKCIVLLSMITKDSHSLANRIREKITATEVQVQIDKTGLREMIKEVEKQITILDEEIKIIESNLLGNHSESKEELFLPTRLREDYLPARLEK